MKKIVKAMIIAALIMWVVCSLNEVYTHNEATFYGYSHEYSSWNIFTLLFDDHYVITNN